jgi:all-trans-retinol 13,14-reductase
MNTKVYDYIIIGSGIGGLVSALILAKEGKKVCVLEKNNQYGGNLQTFVRNKTIFDTGVHYLGGLSKNQNLYQYFKYLNIIDDLKLQKMDEDAFDFITFDQSDVKYPHAQGYENFVNQLLKYFPEERKCLEKYCQDIINVCDSFPLYNINNSDEGYKIEILEINTKVYFDNLTSNELFKAVLLGNNFLYAGIAEKTPFYVHALSVNSYIQGAYRCINGGSQISKQLIKQLRIYDGEVFKHVEIKNSLFENDLPIAVIDQNDKKYFAHNFISNIDLKRTTQIFGVENFRKPYINRINSLEPSISAFSVYIVLKPNTLKYINSNFYHISDIKNIWEAMDYNQENWPKGYMLSMGVSEENQEWAESLTAITYMKYEDVKAWENTFNTVKKEADRGESYEHFKNFYIEKMLKKMEIKIPNIREYIAHVHCSTPLSYRDYIGGENGNMYGYVKDSNNPMKTFIATKTKIPNVYLTGHSVSMHGILGVTIGAFLTCCEILGKTYLINKINHEINQ